MSPSLETPQPAYLTALITGSSSGIGLALATHLLSLNTTIPWRVLFCDINPHTAKSSIEMLISQGYSPSRIKFIETDVSSFSSNATAFKTAWHWDDARRVDFFAANAGISLKQNGVVDFFPQEAPDGDLDGEPVEPDLRVIDTNLKSVYYGLKCFLWYIRKTRNLSLSTRVPRAPENIFFKPKMVITASCAALYGFPIDPPYSSAKSGLINLVYSLSRRLYVEVSLCLNAICPGLVVTNIMPIAVQESAPEETRTPMNVIMKAYDELIDELGHIETAGGMDGGTDKYGLIIETSGSRLYRRERAAFCDENMSWIIEDPDGFWKGDLLRETKKLGGEKEHCEQTDR